MSKLTSKARDRIPSSEFAMPGDRKYPLNDANHARNAKARASEMANKGRISKSTEEMIDRKANAKLGHKSPFQKADERRMKGKH